MRDTFENTYKWQGYFYLEKIISAVAFFYAAETFSFFPTLENYFCFYSIKFLLIDQTSQLFKKCVLFSKKERKCVWLPTAWPKRLNFTVKQVVLISE